MKYLTTKAILKYLSKLTGRNIKSTDFIWCLKDLGLVDEHNEPTYSARTLYIIKQTKRKTKILWSVDIVNRIAETYYEVEK